MVDAAFWNPVLRSYFPDLGHRVLMLSRSFFDREGEVRITPAPGRDVLRRRSAVSGAVAEASGRAKSAAW
ncbi:MAG: hypothetical protein ACRDNL_19755 [Spirillospora sp.]